jgi:hypothetical protein
MLVLSVKSIPSIHVSVQHLQWQYWYSIWSFCNVIFAYAYSNNVCFPLKNFTIKANLMVSVFAVRRTALPFGNSRGWENLRTNPNKTTQSGVKTADSHAICSLPPRSTRPSRNCPFLSHLSETKERNYSSRSFAYKLSLISSPIFISPVRRRSDAACGRRIWARQWPWGRTGLRTPLPEHVTWPFHARGRRPTVRRWLNRGASPLSSSICPPICISSWYFAIHLRQEQGRRRE